MRGAFALVLACIAITATISLSATTLACEGGLQNSPLCLELKRAVESKSEVELLRIEIDSIQSPTWPEGKEATANAQYDEGLRLFTNEYYGDAAVYFEDAVAIYRDLIEGFDQQREGLRESAEKAFSERRFNDAIELFEELLTLQDKADYRQAIDQARQGLSDEATLTSANQAYEDGNLEFAMDLLNQLITSWFVDERDGLLRKIKDAQRIDLHNATISQARSALRSGDTIEATRLFTQALELAPGSIDAKTGLRSVRVQLTNRDISKGYALLDDGEVELAVQSFNNALERNPNSQAAKEGIEEANDISVRRDITILEHRLKIAEETEEWGEASGLASRLARLRPHDQQYSISLARYDELAEYEERLDFLLANPSRFTSKNVRSEVDSVLDGLTSLPQPGEKIRGKHSKLRQSFASATVKKEIKIFSDGRTEVVISPGKKLGTFKELTVSTYPGKYRISGRRAGYREVVRNVDVASDGGPYEIHIVASQKF